MAHGVLVSLGFWPSLHVAAALAGGDAVVVADVVAEIGGGGDAGEEAADVDSDGIAAAVFGGSCCYGTFVMKGWLCAVAADVPGFHQVAG